MIVYPQVDVKEWCAQYKIETTEDACINCKKIIPYEVPIASKNWRGVIQKVHDCGHEYVRSILVPIGKEADDWKNIVFGEL